MVDSSDIRQDKQYLRFSRVRLSLGLLLLAGASLFLLPYVWWRVIGLSRGEAFYRGRPTSWWSKEIDQYFVFPGPLDSAGVMGYSRRSFWDWNISWMYASEPPPITLVMPHPPLLEGDLESLDVLVELLRSPNSRTRRIAIYGLSEIGPRARDAIPQIRSAIASLEDPWSQVETLRYLRKIDPAASMHPQ